MQAMPRPSISEPRYFSDSPGSCPTVKPETLAVDFLFLVEKLNETCIAGGRTRSRVHRLLRALQLDRKRQLDLLDGVFDSIGLTVHQNASSSHGLANPDFLGIFAVAHP